MTTLRGITWSHTRGYLPMVATAQRYQELNPGVEIHWEKRSLRQFEEVPIEELAQSHDLLVVDHPFIGKAARDRIFQPLETWLSPEYLGDQATNSVGASHASYQLGGHQWALAIDAATPVAAWRPDLLQALGLAVPQTWADVLAMARRGHVEVPGAPINCLMNFLGLCATVGEPPFSRSDRVVSGEVGGRALGLLAELHAACGHGSLERNPIASLDLLASQANLEKAYCLFPYGYSNYSRRGYADHLLQFGDLPALEPGGPPMTSTLGGAGLAVSSHSRHAAEAAGYARYVASPRVQATLYTQAGGQPGHRAAWLDEENNRLASGYFRATLPALDRAYLRPRYPGYLRGFQDPAGPALQRHLTGEVSAARALSELDRLHSASLQHD